MNLVESFASFFSFADVNVRYVTLGSVLLGMSSALVGVFAFLRKKSLVGDVVAHSVLAGVCLAFMISGTKHPLALTLGASITGWLSLYCVDLVKNYTPIKEDTAIGLVLSVFFGIGILLLTTIQHSGNAAQAGLDNFIFGKAAALVGTDVYFFALIATVLMLSVAFFFKEFTLISFDPNFAKVIGFPVRKLELLLTTLTVLAVVTGIQAVGVVLMAAMLITPAATARFWTDNLKIMLFLAMGIGALASISGAFVSFAKPNMPTGPWIVLIASFLALSSFLLAPRKGILAKIFLQMRNKRQFADENVLKSLYQLGENGKDFLCERTITEILGRREFEPKTLKASLGRLCKQGYLKKTTEGWHFTTEGFEKGKRITKLHRLWELYLTEILRLAPDHVHDDAETMEHIITPELEKRLEERLKFPKVDPHNTEIPK